MKVYQILNVWGHDAGTDDGRFAVFASKEEAEEWKDDILEGRCGFSIIEKELN